MTASKFTIISADTPDAITVDQSGAAGSSPTASASDHAHAAAAAAPTQGIGASNAAGSAGTFIHSDHDHTIRESGGQDLTMGAVADGQVLTRSGTTIAGATGVAPSAHASTHEDAGGDEIEVTNTMMAQMAANTVKANATAGAADPADLIMGASTMLARLAAGNIVAATPTEINTLLDTVTITGTQTVTGTKTFADPIIQGTLGSTVSAVTFQRTTSGKTQLNVQSNGAFDADLTTIYGTDANASYKLSQKATSMQIIYGSSLIFALHNSTKQDADTIFRGTTDNNLLKVDAGLDAVGIGVATAVNANAILDIQSTTKGVLMPRMTAAQASAVTGVNGMMLYASSTDATFTSIGIWAYENGAWAKL